MDPQVERLSERYFESLNCPRSLTAAILLRYGEYEQLANLRAIPSEYATAEHFWLSACASDWLRKYPGLPGYTDELREKSAKESWYQSELECWETNLRLAKPGVVLAQLLDIAADWMADLIGPFPLDIAPYFGPGATVSDPATHTTVLDKVSSLPSMTESFRDMLPLWRGTAWERSHERLSVSENNNRPYSPTVVEGNVFFCVPKEATTFRGCAKGPSLNVAYQLGAGKAIRRNLLDRFAYDISAKQFEHRKLACEGSANGGLATIDSSRASDTLSYELVKTLLKKAPLWFTLLDALREQSTLIDNQWVELNKFSSMGNGYTFELETLVFLSLALAIATVRGENSTALLASGHISVYGDDVIVPTDMALEVINLLRACGFTVNTRKSYLDGNFRESCGGDYFYGVCVNTPKLKEEINDVAGWFSVHNKLMNRVCESPISGKMRRAWVLLQVVKDQLPRRYRSMYGPRWLGDKVLHGWYGPQVSAKARRVLISRPDVGPPYYVTDPNQWVGSLEVLTPVDNRAAFDDYSDEAQLAYVLYTSRADPPVRRPTQKVRYRITAFECDYHIMFEDHERVVWPGLTKTRFRQHFGV
jgi:hypothetical protein